MKVFEGIDHEIQRLYVHWDITTKCNYKCSYCYAMLDYEEKKKWFKESKKDSVDIIIKTITRSSLPIFLGLLGGEPTMSEHYFYILKRLQEVFFKKERDRLYITTNLSKSLSWWKDHPKIEKTFILASFHPEYHNKDSIIKFIDKLIYLKQYFKVKVNIMLQPGKDEILNEFYKYLNLLKDKKILIHPHIIYPDGSPFKDINLIYKNNIEKYKKFFDYMDSEYIYNNIELTDYQVFSKKLNQFKNWHCYQNNYEISYDGFVNNICFNKNWDLKDAKNINLFKNIKKIRPRLCPHDYCSCDGLLKCKKFKKE